ncbi:antitoxin [Streptomyces sp. uw30]|uniref:antitoxin n=1 Tax=Streptomyces sp. uw30 TaxID=1828179 RepID=UPI0011CEC957|nr:antitoxin [Streptomyces sp. uw30]TXS53956.1 antitoxin [Streptomyces sp. uw30]
MGLKDNLKAKLAPAKDKVSDFAQRHEGKVHHGIERAAKAVDARTKGKYSDKIHTGTGKAKGAMDRLAHKGDDTATGDSRPPSDSPPPTT